MIDDATGRVGPVGLSIESSPHIPDATIVWRRGREAIGICSSSSQKFWRMFGFVPAAPKGCDGITVSLATYTMLQQDLAELEAGRAALSTPSPSDPTDASTERREG